MTKRELKKREVADEVVAMHAAQLTNTQIAAELDLDPKTVAAILQGRGMGTPPRIPIDVDKLIERYQGDGSINIILADFNLTATTLYRILAENHIPLRQLTRIGQNKALLDAAVEFYLKGYPLWAIHDETGLQPPAVYAELRERGVPIQRRKGRRTDKFPAELTQGIPERTPLPKEQKSPL